MKFIASLLSLLAVAALPPAPTDGIRDDARVLSERGRATLVKEMQEFNARTGLLMFVDTNTFLDNSTNVRARARQLLPAWSGVRAGVLVCIDRSASEPPCIQVADPIWKRSSEPEVLAVIDEATRRLGEQGMSETTLINGMRLLMEKLSELDQLATARAEVWKHSDRLLATWLLACALLGAACTWLISRRLRSSEGAESAQHWFPDVSVGQRFGAPIGGGVIVVLTYHREV